MDFKPTSTQKKDKKTPSKIAKIVEEIETNGPPETGFMTQMSHHLTS